MPRGSTPRGTGRWSRDRRGCRAGRRRVGHGLTALVARSRSVPCRARDSRGPAPSARRTCRSATWKFTSAGCAVLHLVERRQLVRVGLDVGELAVVPDRADEERLLVLGRAVHELQVDRDTAADTWRSLRSRDGSPRRRRRAPPSVRLAARRPARRCSTSASRCGAFGSAFTYTFRSGVPPPLFSLSRNEYTVPLAVTRFRLVAAPSLAGLTCAMLCVALMTQKSLSPQMTSRISSPSGSTIIVV